MGVRTRSIKALVIVGIALFLVITLFSLLIPSKVRVSRAVLIHDTNTGTIISLADSLENWKKWHPVFTKANAILKKDLVNSPDGHTVYRIVHLDKEIKVTMSGTDTSSVRFLLQGEGENDINNEIVVSTASPQSVQVEWRAITSLRWYPWEKFYGIFIDRLTGSGYEDALNGLKAFVENN